MSAFVYIMVQLLLDGAAFWIWWNIMYLGIWSYINYILQLYIISYGNVILINIYMYTAQCCGSVDDLLYYIGMYYGEIKLCPMNSTI